uniref:Uncharacterized protein n=1 Tax=viral metagenome TaxID=1070528 RepID=A0A6M3JM03_9ZZZZ
MEDIPTKNRSSIATVMGSEPIKDSNYTAITIWVTSEVGSQIAKDNPGLMEIKW